MEKKPTCNENKLNENKLLQKTKAIVSLELKLNFTAGNFF